MTWERLAALGDALVRVGIALGCLFVLWLLLGAYLSRRRPVAYWYGYGFWFLLWRMRRTWSRLTLNADLTASERPNTGVFGSLVVKGRPLRPAVPLLIKIRPRRFGATAVVALQPGQVPQPFIDAADAMAHTWGVHAVRAAASRRGRVDLTILRADPLGDSSMRDLRSTSPGAAVPVAVPEDLCAEIGNREDGQSWVLDLIALPHWLITGATQSGKSTLINAAVAQWAARPIALVGIDCKGGMELASLAPRLSALAYDRAQAADLLGHLVTEAERRMALCREHRARNIWQLPEHLRPAPVIVIVDELAELYLIASREQKDAALRATTNLLRLGQLGAALGIHLILAGQRVGTDLGPGISALRAQLGGRICLKVHDPETAKMTLGDLHPDAVDAAQLIGPADKGVAITTADHFGWVRARSVKFTDDDLDQAVHATRHLTPRIPGLTPPADPPVA
ncbi:FtsK/SpoIIIE domain-containing protein [Paractinoplanes brasiliensis]|uniref:S-DNA-T family DNA segregation ATPase FtsK/SpoIIIE n=1 Tax=Paractinoplanes brasiliensis TaxID=52695 RepID=A0A4R6JP88_9ACTN|nr:FtsK/SpoIIIE domain-containing protein [Actinoplanes brasiliensis]TDO38230.1 S-DNA-T family DNA segregation ATPase FtsK/SpoIIIE [Actinoplanes brasiliensis]GID26993.1 conjugal transfer protein TraS [Actinoplanes brasiliensis]